MTEHTEYPKEQWLHDLIYVAKLNKKTKITISLSAFLDLVYDREAWRTAAKSYERIRNEKEAKK